MTQQTVVTVALTRQRARLLRLAYGSYFRSRRMDPQARAHIVKLPELLRGRNDQASSTHNPVRARRGKHRPRHQSSSMLLCPGTPLNRFDRRPVKKERSLTPSINLRGTIKALQCPKTTGTGFSHAKQPRTADRDEPYPGPAPPYDRSRSVKRRTSGCGRGDRAAKLGISRVCDGPPHSCWSYHSKNRGFQRLGGTISGLTSITSRNEAHLAKIAAAEKAGLIVLTCLIGELRQRNQQKRATGTLTTNLAA